MTDWWAYQDYLAHSKGPWKKHKYSAKIKLPSGKFKYVYGGSILQDEPDSSEYKEAERKYRELFQKARKNDPSFNADEYYKALDDYKAKQSAYNEKMSAYKKTASYKIRNPRETAKNAADKLSDMAYSAKLDVEYGIKDKLGITAKNRMTKAKAKLDRLQQYDKIFSDESSKAELARGQAHYNNALKDYYKTPIGKLAMYKDAISAAKEWVNSPYEKTR